MFSRAILYTTIVFFLLSGPIETLVARHISPDYQYRTTVVVSVLSGLGSFTFAWFRHRQNVIRALIAAWPMLCFCLIAIVSFSWSILPSKTIAAGFSLTMFALAVIALSAMVSWRDMLLGILYACFALGILSLFLIPFGGLMDEIHVGALRGPYGEKNRAGVVFAIGAITCMSVAFTRRQPGWLLYLPFFLLLLFLTRSGTATIACGVAMAALSYGEMLRDRPRRLIFGLWFGTIAVAVIGVVIIANAELLLELVGEDTTFTGRSVIWPSVIDRIESAPWLGLGYDAYWREGNTDMNWLWYEAGFEVYNAHNSWLESMLAVGYIGTFFIFVMCLRTGLIGVVSLNRNNDPRRFALPAILLIIMMSLTESIIGGPEGPGWLFFLLIATKAASPRDLIQSPPSPTIQQR